jgi:hypothetical protein
MKLAHKLSERQDDMLFEKVIKDESGIFKKADIADRY